MVRYVVEGSPISVAYGRDNLSGVFLDVTDERLEWKDDASKAVNEVTEKIGVRDGGGSYFNLHTGPIGYGQRVDMATMTVFLRRFGANEEHIASLGVDLMDINNFTEVATSDIFSKGLTCPACRAKATSACAKCGAVAYCSKACQKTGEWVTYRILRPVHGILCAV